MIKNVYQQSAKLAVFISALLMADVAAAGVTFGSNADLSFAIGNIVETGTGAAVDYSGLNIYGLMVREADPFLAWTNISGDGVVNDAQQEIPYMEGPVSVGNFFTNAFNINGSVNDGAIDLNQTAYYDVGLVNNSSFSFDVTLNLSYTLSSQVSGPSDSGNVGATINFMDDAFSTILADSVDGVSGLPGYSQVSNAFYTFTIGPDEFKTFYVDVNHNGQLEASPVPLPAAIWPFMTGLLAMVGLRKRKAA